MKERSEVERGRRRNRNGKEGKVRREREGRVEGRVDERGKAKAG